MVNPNIIARVDQDGAFAEEVIDGLEAFFRIEDISGMKLAYAAAAILSEFEPDQLAYLVTAAVRRLALQHRDDDVIDTDALLDGGLHEGLFDQEAQE